MTVIDTIITCALYMWHGLSWVVSCTWYCSEIVHAFYVEQPSSVQIALFIGFILIAWLLVVFGTGFYNKFMAVPENEIWINTVQIALFAWNAGERFGTCVVFTGEGFMEVFKGIFVLLKGLGKFVVGFLGFIIIGFAWPFLAFIVGFYALCAIVYGISWACRDTDRIFMTLEPSHTIAFRRAAGLSVPEQAAQSARHEQAAQSARHEQATQSARHEQATQSARHEQAPQSARHEQATQSARHEQAPQAARPTNPEQAPPRRASPASGPTRYDGPVRNRPASGSRPAPSRYAPALDPEFEPLRPSSAYRYFDERD